MASQKVNDANRKNSAKSTGPRTKEGKAASRLNAYRHGMRSRQVVIPGEDRAEYEQLSAELHREYRPQTNYEHFLVRQLADCQWRLERLKGIEAALLDETDINLAEMERISIWQGRMERAYYKAIAELNRLRKEAAEIARKEEDQFNDAEPPHDVVLYWKDEDGNTVLAPGFTEDGPIDDRLELKKPPEQK